MIFDCIRKLLSLTSVPDQPFPHHENPSSAELTTDPNSIILESDDATCRRAMERILDNFYNDGKGHRTRHLYIAALEEHCPCHFKVITTGAHVIFDTIATIGYLDESRRDIFFITTVANRTVYVRTAKAESA